MRATAHQASTAHCEHRHCHAAITAPSFRERVLVRPDAHRCEVCAEDHYFDHGTCRICPKLSSTIGISCMVFVAMFTFAFAIFVLGTSPEMVMALSKQLAEQTLIISRKFTRRLSGTVAKSLSKELGLKMSSISISAHPDTRQFGFLRSPLPQWARAAKSQRRAGLTASAIQSHSQYTVWMLDRVAFIPKLKVGHTSFEPTRAALSRWMG